VDDETQRQIDELLEEHTAREKEQRATRRRLAVLREQAAIAGRDAPAHVVTEIEDLEKKTARLTSDLREIKRNLSRLTASASTAALFSVSSDELRQPERAVAVLAAQLPALYRMLQEIQERFIEYRAAVDERLEAIEKASAEWRQGEREARTVGQSAYRLAFQVIAAVLLLLLVAVVVILILILVRT
jgi:chromosome segregation ATPase